MHTSQCCTISVSFSGFEETCNSLRTWFLSLYVYYIAFSDNGIYHTWIFNCHMSKKQVYSEPFISRNYVIKWMWIMKYCMWQKTGSFFGVDVWVKKQLLIHNIYSYKYFISKNTLQAWYNAFYLWSKYSELAVNKECTSLFSTINFFSQFEEMCCSFRNVFWSHVCPFHYFSRQLFVIPRFSAVKGIG